MKKIYFLSLLCACTFVKAQLPVSTITTSSASAATAITYVNGGNTYNWGVAPNNGVVSVNGFTAGSLIYTYANGINGIVKIRRVNNALTTGLFSLVWAETNVLNSFNMLPEYESNMETFFDGKTYNKGTDNFFDNTSANSNNVERLDWIYASGFSNTNITKVGFLVVERGADNAHDPFCIAAITSLDASGNPASYGAIKRVATTQYGNITSSALNYRILKGAQGTNLLDAGTNTQNRGGVFISLSDLGITGTTTVYGYSLFANDVPAAAVPADLVNFNNATNFPINTGGPGGIDLVGITGVYYETSLAGVNDMSIKATIINNTSTIKLSVDEEDNVHDYTLERSENGVLFYPIQKKNANNNNSNHSYSFTDDVTSISKEIIFYRVIQTHNTGKTEYSKIVSVKKNTDNKVMVFPNPAANTLSVNYFSASVEKVTIDIISTKGDIVKTFSHLMFIGNNTFTTKEIAALAKGNYCLKIKSNSSSKMNTVFFEKL
jgi:Secretion system C-terminal sorting domain